jgi:hypothetical protein
MADTIKNNGFCVYVTSSLSRETLVYLQNCRVLQAFIFIWNSYYLILSSHLSSRFQNKMSLHATAVFSSCVLHCTKCIKCVPLGPVSHVFST